MAALEAPWGTTIFSGVRRANSLPPTWRFSWSGLSPLLAISRVCGGLTLPAADAVRRSAWGDQLTHRMVFGGSVRAVRAVAVDVWAAGRTSRLTDSTAIL
jgi:hypothetical protein